MALVADIDYITESPNLLGTFDGAIEDQTTYGTPNADRADVAVYLTGDKIDQNQAVEYAVSIDSYDPTTVTVFDFEVAKDGYYQFKFVIIPNYDNAHDYVQYDVVYSAGVVYQAIANPSIGTAPTNPSFWSVVSAPTELIDLVGTVTEPLNLVYQLYERIIYPFSKTAYGDTADAAALECCSDCERGEDVKTYEFFGVMVAGMNSADQRGKFTRGEKICRKASEIIDTL